MPSEERVSRYVSASTAGLFAAITIRYASFVGVIADSSGYVSEAHRWLESRLFGPLAFTHLPAWPSPALEIPLGYRLGTIAGTDVFTYPPGLPLVMAAAMAVGGDLAAHLVPPLLGGVAVWATGELADTLGGARARVLGAALMATSAIALTMSVGVMSDVPAAAWWALALVFATRNRRSSSLVSGLAVAMAILTRPNLAPLAVVPGFLVVKNHFSGRLVSGLTFAGAASIGLVTLLSTQAMLYDSPLASGHPGMEQAFSLSNVSVNVLRYPRWYLETHTPAIVLALFAPLLVWRARDHVRPQLSPRFTLAVSLLVFSAGVYAAYLSYTPYEHWHFLRFMLPALPPLYALTAAFLGLGIDRLVKGARWPVLVLVLVLTAGAQGHQAYERQFTRLWPMSRPVLQATRYLDAALPSNAVVMTAFHSGSVRDATGRPILRPELIPPQQLDTVVALVEQSGYDLYLLLDEELERKGFNDILAPHTKRLTLDWPPRARIGANNRLSLYRVRDAQRSLPGDSWPVDIVR